jgi:hypothetical protein
MAVEQGRLPDVTRDPARSYEPIDHADLARLARLADTECDEFFSRNRHLAHWRGQLRFVALGQGGADHYLRGERGIWDLDLLLLFGQHRDDRPKPYLRRSVRSWDWGPSKFGRCPYDPPSYSGRAVDVALWVIPDSPDPLDGLRCWLERRHTKNRTVPDLAHQPVVLVAPDRGRIVWDPPNVPPPVQKTIGHRSPAGTVPK